MARFSYVAIDHKNKTVKGTVTAESAYAARKHLRAKGIHATSIKDAPRDEHSKSITSVFKKSARSQVTDFSRQMSTMLNSGIKLTEALSVLTQQITDTQLKNAVTDIRDRVVTGESFAESLEEYKQYFDIIYINMVRVGEVTGTLASTLNTIATFMEKRQKVEAKMATAMIYPMILIFACIMVVLFLTIFVIPVITEQLVSVGHELPWITKALMATSNVLRSWWALVMLLVIFLIAAAIKRFFRTPKGALLKDTTLLRLPVFGPLIKQRIVARFASTLSTMLASGLSMADSLKVVAEVTGNVVMNKAVKQARDRILAGADIATPLRDSGVISPTIAHMVTVGEKSGELEQMLQAISDNLEASSDTVVERLSAAIEPVIILVMVGVVGVIAFATLLPIIKFSAGSF